MMARLLSGLDLDRHLDRIYRDEGAYPSRGFGALVSVLVMIAIFIVVMIVPALD
jgi:hypothetical protein